MNNITCLGFGFKKKIPELTFIMCERSKFCLWLGALAFVLFLRCPSGRYVFYMLGRQQRTSQVSTFVKLKF